MNHACTTTLTGLVTRCTAVKPQIAVATYACEQCGVEVYQQVNKPDFMPLQQCTSEHCTRNKNKGRLHLQTRGSLFYKFQELRIQELVRNIQLALGLTLSHSQSTSPLDMFRAALQWWPSARPRVKRFLETVLRLVVHFNQSY